MEWLLVYGVMLVAFFALDLVWLGAVAGGYYRRELSGLLRTRFKLWAAAVFYLIYLVGVAFFAVDPAHETGSLSEAVFRGAFLGLIAYGTYDLTAYAVVQGWRLSASLVDMAWGTVLTGVTALVGYLVAGWVL